MSISIKTAREIEKMRRAGELLEKVHDELVPRHPSGNVNLGNQQARRRDDPQLRMHSQLFKL